MLLPVHNTAAQGFVLLVDVSESQFEALAGGQVLQQLTFNYKDAISAKAQAKGATRLLAALQQVCLEVSWQGSITASSLWRWCFWLLSVHTLTAP